MIKTGKELAALAKQVATDHKTLYIRGCYGSPMDAEGKQRYTNNLPYNRQEHRKSKILAATADTFGFDCVCFIKGLLWGWEGNAGDAYGGAVYQSNGVPDINADSMIRACKDISTDFAKIQVGEAVWIKGHIGIYIGGGLAVECTHRWADGVQITAVHNIGSKAGYNGRTWTKHGKLPYVTYADTKEITRYCILASGSTTDKALVEDVTAYLERANLSVQVTAKTEIVEVEPEVDIDAIARDVIDGKYGNGQERKDKLGDLYDAVQARVNELAKKK